ncbi:MAG TPA: DNA primase [Solirubrobacteraceae bacterium]|nr:DNA primase [Solirubrobacteraceae bacterium]
MALYTNDSRDRVRDAVDFAELVSTRTELRRSGPSRMEGLCPFHDERTPSFGIDPMQKVYHCFGCGASGDLFTFVQETEGVDFREALELLAERYGVELQREKEDPREQERRMRRERLLELLKRTAGYYERFLWESSEAERAREYLLGRGLSEETLREFKVGYSPSAWDRVLNASRRGGWQNREVYDAGLAQRSQGGKIYDRFRARIMFPLCDTRGRVLGFGARAMSDGRGPKYLNTSDNELYHKGRHVYGADLARAHAARAGSVILCEGYTDVIALHQAGMRNAVGLMGTALTDDQVGELGRMAQTVLLALDADSAGQEAMLRASGLAAKRNLELRVVPLPEGADPAELIQREGPEAVTAAVERSVPFVRFRVERVLANGDHSTPEGQDRMIEELRPVFAQLGEGAMRMELMRMASSRLAVPDRVFEQRLTAAPATAAPSGRGSGGARRADEGERNGSGGGSAQGNGSATRRPKALSGREDAERAFLALCIASPEDGAPMLASVEIEEDFSSEPLRRAARHLAAGDLHEPLAPAPGEDLDADPELQRLLAELVVESGRESVAKPAKLEAQRLQLELARYDRQIQRARGQQSGEVSTLAGKRAEVKRQFDRAYGRVLEETGEREL